MIWNFYSLNYDNKCIEIRFKNIKRKNTLYGLLNI